MSKSRTLSFDSRTRGQATKVADDGAALGWGLRTPGRPPAGSSYGLGYLMRR